MSNDAKNKEVLVKYVSGLISKEEFEKDFNYQADFDSFNEQLENALNNYSEFNMLFWNLPAKMNELQNDKIFKKYLSIRKGHQEHEEMLNYFHKNFIDSEANVIILKSLVDNPPSYFKEADRENVFKEKCLFTIAKQPTTKVNEVLKKFALSTDDTIARASKLYLEKIINNPQ